MTKQEVEEKIKEILSKDKKYKSVKLSITYKDKKKSIKSLCDEDITPTKYQVHKRTKILYATINKYYDDIIQEVQNEKIITATI